jgi:hypothetical protein
MSAGNRAQFYVLDAGGDPVPATSEQWSKWLRDNRSKRIVKQTTLDGRVLVSTVFLGLDHNWESEGPPRIFETMIFGGPWNEYQRRYATKDEALVGHEDACAKALTPCEER